MLHLSNFLPDSFFSEKNEVATSGGVFYGCYIVLNVIPDFTSPGLIFINWETVITILKAAMVPAIMGIVNTLSKEFYEKKISPFIFKVKKNVKEKRKKAETKKRA